ncbi:hypothetical protein GCM10027578_16580 [Spirosoma luteolum]
MNAQLAGFIDEEFVRNLNQQPGAVAGVGFGTHGTAVFHPAEHLKGVGNDLVRLAAPDVGDKANTAVIVFKFRAVKAGAGGVLRSAEGLRGHLVNLIGHGRNSVGFGRRKVVQLRNWYYYGAFIRKFEIIG